MIEIFAHCFKLIANFYRSIEIVPAVNLWTFLIVCAGVIGVASVFWRSGKF